MEYPHYCQRGELLTAREREWLHLVAVGKRDPEISTQTSWSRAEIHRIAQAVNIKLGAKSRPHAVYLALTRGIYIWL